MDLSPQTVRIVLKSAEFRLQQSGALRPLRHAELLLESVLDIDRIQLYLRLQEILSPNQVKHFEELLAKREAGIPVQYLAGWAPFYGRRFWISEGVFIPRFDSETLIDAALSGISEVERTDRKFKILDLGCGCGVLGLTLAAELPFSQITLIDNSDLALTCTQVNADTMQLFHRTEIIKRDALQDFPSDWRGGFNIVIANPPYIPLTEVAQLPFDVRNGEPREALTDFSDGLTFYRRWVETVPQILRTDGRLILEIDDSAAGKVKDILQPAFDNIIIHQDLSGLERAVEGRLR